MCLVGFLACSNVYADHNDGQVISAATATSVVPDFQVIGYFPSWSRVPVSTLVESGVLVAVDLTAINYAFLDICWGGVHGNPDRLDQLEAASNSASASNSIVNAARDGEIARTALPRCQGVSGGDSAVPDGAIVLADPALDTALAGDALADGHGLDHLGQLLNLKHQNPHLELLASVGGWYGSDRFSETAASPVTRASFAQSALEFLRKYQFDGIDIDWEYPGAIGFSCGADRRCQHADDKKNFGLLVDTLRKVLDQAEQVDGKHYLLSIAAGATPSFLQDDDVVPVVASTPMPAKKAPGKVRAAPSAAKMADIRRQARTQTRVRAPASWLRSLAANLDWINLMNYDYHGNWDTQSGLIAPMGYDARDPVATPVSGFGEAMISQFLQQVPARKLVLGMALYGYGWDGCAPGQQGDGLYQPCTGASAEGVNLSQLIESGRLLKDEKGRFTMGARGFRRYWNDSAQLPYLYNPDSKQFMTYEDEASIQAKVGAVRMHGLGGAMFWELSADRLHVLGSVIADALLTR